MATTATAPGTYVMPEGSGYPPGTTYTVSAPIPAGNSGMNIPRSTTKGSAAPQGVASLQSDAAQHQFVIDPEIIKHQKTQSLSLLDNQVGMARDRSKAEYDQAKQSINMKADYDISLTTSAIEQSKAQALFALDQQHQQRRMEIEQRAQEQRMQIEATASQLCMEAKQQKLQKDMNDRLAKLQAQQQQHLPQHQQQYMYASQQYIPQAFAQAVNDGTNYSAFSLYNTQSPYSVQAPAYGQRPGIQSQGENNDTIE